MPVPHCSVQRHRPKASASRWRTPRASPRPVALRPVDPTSGSPSSPVSPAIWPTCCIAALHALHGSPCGTDAAMPRQLHWYLRSLLRHLHRHAHQLAHLARLLRSACRRRRTSGGSTARAASSARSRSTRSPGAGSFGTLKFRQHLENLVCEILNRRPSYLTAAWMMLCAVRNASAFVTGIPASIGASMACVRAIRMVDNASEPVEV